MNFQEFKTDALRTESRPEKLNFSKAGLFALLSIGYKTALLLDTAKKTMFYGKPIDPDNLRDQLFELSKMTMEIGALACDISNPLLDAAMLEDGEKGVFLPLNDPNMRIAHGAIGMFGEAGELLAAVLKQLETGELDMVNVGEEVADSDWYKAIIHDESGISEEAARAKVIAKLKLRYGEKFSSKSALNRNLVAERAALESNV